MGRVILLIWAALFAGELDIGDDPSLIKLRALMQSPQLESSNWRTDVWRQLRVLEHVEDQAVLEGWTALAKSELASDQANLLLYKRRHDISIDPDNFLKNPELAVEWSLALWGEKKFVEAAAFMEAALTKFPEEARLVTNQAWLHLSQVPLKKSDDARAATLLVISRR